MGSGATVSPRKLASSLENPEWQPLHSTVDEVHETLPCKSLELRTEVPCGQVVKQKVAVVKDISAGTSRAYLQDDSVLKPPFGGGEGPSYPEMGGVKITPWAIPTPPVLRDTVICSHTAY